MANNGNLGFPAGNPRFTVQDRAEIKNQAPKAYLLSQDPPAAPGGHPYKPKSVGVPVLLGIYIDKNQRNLDQSAHGGIQKLADNQSISSGNPVNYNTGVGRVCLAVLAGSDISGTITITGTSVDRNDASETGGDTEAVFVDVLTTDSTSADAESNLVHKFENLYISNKWFKGAIALSTTDVNLSDLDVYNIAYEQFNDAKKVIVKTFDSSFYATNALAWLYEYLYAVHGHAGKKFHIKNIASHALTSGDAVADTTYRLRVSGIDKTSTEANLNTSSDGLFSDLHFGPTSQTYFSNFSQKIWVDYYGK